MVNKDSDSDSKATGRDTSHILRCTISNIAWRLLLVTDIMVEEIGLFRQARRHGSLICLAWNLWDVHYERTSEGVGVVIQTVIGFVLHVGGRRQVQHSSYGLADCALA